MPRYDCRRMLNIPAVAVPPPSVNRHTLAAHCAILPRWPHNLLYPLRNRPSSNVSLSLRSGRSRRQLLAISLGCVLPFEHPLAGRHLALFSLAFVRFSTGA